MLVEPHPPVQHAEGPGPATPAMPSDHEKFFPYCTAVVRAHLARGVPPVSPPEWTAADHDRAYAIVEEMLRRLHVRQSVGGPGI